MNQLTKLFIAQVFTLILAGIVFQAHCSTTDNCIVEIDNDTIFGVWNDSCTYIIKRDAVLPTDKSLEIKPGCTVLLYPDVRLKIEGNLIAQGDEDNPIVFTSFDANNYWNCLYFENQEAVSLKYCHFKNTIKKDSRRGALHFGIYAHLFKVSNCTFENNKSGVVFIDRLRNRIETVAFEYNTIVNSEDFGFSVFGGEFGIINFKNNKIEGKIYSNDSPFNERVGFTGIRIGEVFAGKINFRDNKIVNASFKYDIDRKFFNHPGGGILIQPNASNLIGEIKFERDTLTYNEGKFAALYAHCDDSIIIRDVLIERNAAINGGGYLSANEIKIDNTGFLNNQNIDSRYSPDAGGGGLTVEHRKNSSKVEISNSRFIQNRAQDGNGGGISFKGNNHTLNKIFISNTFFSENLADRDGGAIYADNYKQINYVSLGFGNSFLSNLAEIGNLGGGGILVNNIDSIGKFIFSQTARITGHSTGYGNGGFLCLNQVNRIGALHYSENKHENSVSSPKGSGGLAYLGIVLADSIVFNTNSGINAVAQKSGGTVYINDGADIKNLILADNEVVSTESKEGTGGFISADVNSVGNFVLRSNRITASKASGGSGGTVYLQTAHNSILNPDIAVGNKSAISSSQEFVGFESYTNDTIIIEKNQINTSFANGSGGMVFLNYNSAKPVSKFRFYNNMLQNTRAGINGGTLFFTGNITDNNAGIEILENVVNVKSESGGEGGFIYLKGYLKNAFYIRNNTIQNSEALNRGGAFFIENYSDGLNQVHFTENSIGESTSSVNNKGGFAFLKSNVQNEFSFTGNTLKKSNAGDSGGAIWMENLNDSNLFRFVIKDNIIGTAKSSGSGGFVFLKTNKLNSVLLESNEVQDSTVAYQSGGGLHIETDLVQKFVSKNNSIAQSVAYGGDGGFVNLITSGLGSYSQEKNKFLNTFSAFGNGGVVSLRSDTINEFTIFENQCMGGLFANNGGYIAVESDFVNDSTILAIEGNEFHSTANVHNNGGVFYLKGTINSEFSFSKNKFKNSIHAVNNGGVMFVHNSHGRNNNILFEHNSVVNDSRDITLRAKNGSFLHFEGFFHTHYFGFNSDTIQAATALADSVGGVFYLKNEFEDKHINHIEINKNQFSNLNAVVNGSILSIVGKVDSTFSFKNNKVTSSNVTGEDITDEIFDGSIYFRNTRPEGLETLQINSNQFSGNEIQKGGGGILKYVGTHIENAKVAINKVEMASTSQEGLFAFFTDSITSFRGVDNRFEDIKSRTGGIYHFSGMDKTNLNTVELLRDKIKNSTAAYEASGLYLDALSVDTLIVDGWEVNNSRAEGSGGLISCRIGISVDQTGFKNNTIENSSSGENGGVVNLVGEFNNITIENDSVYNYFAERNGGAYHFVGLESNRAIGNVQILHSAFQNNRQLETGGKGGAFYFHTVDSVHFSGNFFDQSVAVGPGGGIWSRYNKKIAVDNTEFIWNESLDNNGGAIALENYGKFISAHNKINSNFAKNGKGGGIFTNYGFIEMKHDSLVYCSARSGGGMYLDNFAGTIDSTCFIRNYTAEQEDNISYGAGIYFNKNIEQEDITLLDNKFYRNSAVRGGAVYCDSSEVRIIRGIFAFNNTKEHGGAVYLDDQSTGSQFYNCIFQSNEIVALEENFIFDDCPAAGIQLIFRNNLEADTAKIINCLFTNNQGMAVSVHPNSHINSNNRCLILNSELYYNKYFSQEQFQFCPDNKFIIPEYSNIQNIDTLKYISCIKEPPRWGPDLSYCLEKDSKNIDAGHPGEIYFDICGSGTLQNDIGVTGGPFGFCSCNATIIKDDEACMTNLEEFDESYFNVYPNPSRGNVTLSFEKIISNELEIRVYSLYGKLMLNYQFKNGLLNRTKNLDLTGLPQGSYFIRITDAEKSVAAKIIIL